MKKFLLIASLFIYTDSFCQSERHIFEYPNLKSLISTAKKVAILPFNVSISYEKMPKGMSLEQIKDNEKAESIQMQQEMYTYLVMKSDNYSVSFQEVDRTNYLLKKSGVFENLDNILSDSLCRILGVDAIIKSNCAYANTGSEAATIASMVLVHVPIMVRGSGRFVMQINSSKDGETVWRMSKEMREYGLSSANALMERMMRNVGRVFPFQK
jgi:hypothetical protein